MYVHARNSDIIFEELKVVVTHAHHYQKAEEEEVGPLSIRPTLELFEKEHCWKFLRDGVERTNNVGFPERLDIILK